jgi:hypothetical protein
VKKVKAGGDLRLVAASLSDDIPEKGWLRQARAPDTAFVSGRTIEQQALDACTRGAEDLGRVLRRWRSHLRSLEQDAVAAPDHPFRGPASQRCLPAEYLDVSLSNFVVDDLGRLHYVDSEWQAPGPVDADLVAARALWAFAVDLVHHGVSHPWPPASTVDELAKRLGDLSETPADQALLVRWKAAESDLQAKIHGRPVAEVRAELDSAGETTRLSGVVSRQLPFTALRRQARELQARLAQHEEALALREAELRAFRESTSWKLTRPLRALGRTITRLKGGGG